jgi:hypothetical protein
MRVFVYRNLHRKGCSYSLRAVEGPYEGKVIGYAERLLLSNPQFYVSETGRQRVIKTLRKNVHAGIIGDVIDADYYESRHNRVSLKQLVDEHRAWFPWKELHEIAEPISYNPYKFGYFYFKSTTAPVYSPVYVSIHETDVRYINDDLFRSPTCVALLTQGALHGVQVELSA